jgi:hypothetical protein
MTIDTAALVASVVARLPDTTPDPDRPAPTAARVRAWLSGPAPSVPELDALCRQIDVRHTLAAAYGPDWTRVDPETPADPATIAGVVALLLQSGGTPDGATDDGRGLKYANSALKALELRDGVPDAPQLRAWAVRLLDDRTRST